MRGPRWQSREPPVGVTEAVHEGWDQQRADHGAVQQDGERESDANTLSSSREDVARGAAAVTKTSAAEVNRRPVCCRPKATAIGVG